MLGLGLGPGVHGGFELVCGLTMVSSRSTAAVSLTFAGTMILLTLHTFLLCVNKTTLEHFRLNTGARYNLGCFANFSQILGNTPIIWCVPCMWGVDIQVYNGGEWEPGRIIVVPSSSPEVRS